MIGIGVRRRQNRSAHAGVAISVGLAHFLAPRVFEPFNRLGFPEHARAFTYINGGLETTLGIMRAIPRTRRHAHILGLCYITYLTTCIIATQLRSRRDAKRDSRLVR
jgi:uncharacterized membrane protein